MSGGAGGGIPECAGKDYSMQFFTPTAADVYRVGDTVSLRWYAGLVPQVDDAHAVEVELSLSSGSSNDADVIIMNTTVLSYGQVVTTEGQSWGVLDMCGNTAMTYDWIIPKDQSTASNIKYTILASNVTISDSRSVIALSEPFLIQADPAVSSSSLTSTPTSSSGSPTPPPTESIPPSTESIPPPISPTPSPSTAALSQGAKIGIGVAVPLAVILLGLIGWLAWRRRLQARNASTAGTNIEDYQKPELDASVEKQRAEIGGGEIAEADGGAGVDGRHHQPAENWQEPQELDGSNIRTK
ncbi:hypothetical protein F4808DRAFT_54797 [Astrocystis sublimbata]|nr:hypothetical protein F4808DRAFT_54797 [Astrocystis sublimbata]